MDDLVKRLRDDALERMHGLGKPDGPAIEDQAAREIERLRKIEVAAQEFRQVTDRAWRNGDFSHVINNANQQALWRALDGSPIAPGEGDD